MKNKDFINKFKNADIKVLKTEIAARQKQLNDLISQSVSGKLKNTRQPKVLRREIAKLHTLIKEKEYER